MYFRKYGMDLKHKANDSNKQFCRCLICEYCWSPMPEGGLVWCDACGLVRYCGGLCKERGWEEHEIECTYIGQEGAEGWVLNDPLRLVARIWIKIKLEGSDILEEHLTLESAWSDLTDNAEDLLATREKFLQAQYRLLGSVMRKVDMPDMKTFVSIYGKMFVNAFSLRTDTR